MARRSRAGENSGKTTIYDIARISGASASTVSAVLSGTWKERRIRENTAEAIRKIAAAIESPGGEQAVTLKVAEKAVEAYANLAQKNNTMIVPGNMTEVSALIGTAMTLMKSVRPS